MRKQEIIHNSIDDNILFEKISAIINDARSRVITAVNTAEVYAKYEIGRYIIEYEQQGYNRAQYGKQVLQNLAVRLSESFGVGWSYSNLRQIRQFYLAYENLTGTVCQIENDKKN